MFITIDLNNPTPTYLQIAEAVRRAMATGSLQAGDRLPTIREAAVQARVNRNTVSRAYLELEHQNLVRARQGSGYYVTDNGPGLDLEERLRGLEKRAHELVQEARLSQTDTEALIQIVRRCAKEFENRTESSGEES